MTTNVCSNFVKSQLGNKQNGYSILFTLMDCFETMNLSQTVKSTAI